MFLVVWYNIDFCGFWVGCLLVVGLRFGYLDELWFWVFRYECGFVCIVGLLCFLGLGALGGLLCYIDSEFPVGCWRVVWGDLADWLLPESSACWLDLCACWWLVYGFVGFGWGSGWVWYCLGFAGFGGSFGLGVFAVLVWVLLARDELLLVCVADMVFVAFGFC